METSGAVKVEKKEKAIFQPVQKKEYKVKKEVANIAKIALKVDCKDKQWILDSGCTSHMTGDKSKLSKLNKSREGRVKFGNDDSLNINGRGSVKIGRGTLKDVLHVEGLKYNLASVSQLCNEDHKVIFTKTDCQVKSKEGNTIAAGKRTAGNLYVIDEDKPSSYLLTKEEENQRWHRRLGHLSQKNMRKLTTTHAIKDIPDLRREKEYVCLACSKGKYVRK